MITESVVSMEKTVQEISAEIEKPFTIRLWEDRTRGSRWAPVYDTSALQLIEDDFDRTRDIRVSDIGMHCFEFRPMKAGRHILVFESRYGWKFSSDGRLTYEVEVRG